MMIKTNSLSIKVPTKAGGFGGNHNRALKNGRLQVKVASKAGGFGGNHNRALRV